MGNLAGKKSFGQRSKNYGLFYEKVLKPTIFSADHYIYKDSDYLHANFNDHSNEFRCHWLHNDIHHNANFILYKNIYYMDIYYEEGKIRNFARNLRYDRYFRTNIFVNDILYHRQLNENKMKAFQEYFKSQFDELLIYKIL